jgi:acyl carrier protein
MSDQIRAILREHGRLSADVDTLADGDDLYAAGLTSHCCVNVMLAIEDEFDFEFPDELLRKTTFQSVASIREALEHVGVPTTTT